MTILFLFLLLFLLMFIGVPVGIAFILVNTVAAFILFGRFGGVDANLFAGINQLTDNAFAKLAPATRAALWSNDNPKDQELRERFLLRHLVFGDILTTALKPSQQLETLEELWVQL